MISGKTTARGPHLQYAQMMQRKLIFGKRTLHVVVLVLYVGTGCQMSMEHRNLLEGRSNFPCWNISMTSEKMTVRVSQLRNVQMILWRLRRLRRPRKQRRLRKLVRLMVFVGTNSQMSIEHRHVLQWPSNFPCWNT